MILVGGFCFLNVYFVVFFMKFIYAIGGAIVVIVIGLTVTWYGLNGFTDNVPQEHVSAEISSIRDTWTVEREYFRQVVTIEITGHLVSLGDASNEEASYYFKDGQISWTYHENRAFGPFDSECTYIEDRDGSGSASLNYLEDADHNWIDVDFLNNEYTVEASTPGQVMRTYKRKGPSFAECNAVPSNRQDTVPIDTGFVYNYTRGSTVLSGSINTLNDNSLRSDNRTVIYKNVETRNIVWDLKLPS